MATPSQHPRPGSGDRRPVASVTTASPSAQVERDHRLKVYLWQMGLRIVTFPIGAWLIIQRISVPVGVLLLAFAVLIPYIAVVKANARTVEAPGAGPDQVGPRVRPLEAPTEQPTGAHRGPEVVVGDVVDD
ncbi:MULTISPECIES: DUF3099 domain-containing protein [Kytococcus]|uniref:DUF3099 domain-containing protein n=1 Tax=Kytococcus schroeteri TaxID=138300 RepID=A0A2I1PE06_9MICO|nr:MULTISPECIES: DUF3099 domain-containing protein [Kytococcus]OFS11122.1 hypothetical protein HMPREF3099_08080 [Kytococcus sp. HMSC28H12]PKZ42841.1 DUF3099 domain-containing protein [Kytococcus schroeteri]